ncbi:MAG: glucokinase [Rhodocyclaceae bacterium]|nr:glucokinase [Rhodocyclaceae bacterium]
MRTLLCCDIGGTLMRIALFVQEGGKTQLIRRECYRSASFREAAEALAAFSPPAGVMAAFAVAGPVSGRRARITNLPWIIDADALLQRFRWTSCALLNDLEAVAWAIPILPASASLVVQEGLVGAQGNQAVIAAGTGLGEAGLYWDGHTHHPYACEGGHTSFAPRNERELALWRRLHEQYGHVSWERVVSGMGLPQLYDHLCREAGVPPAIDLTKPDAAEQITHWAHQGDPLCDETLRWFVSLYGAEAGNLALKTMSRGGVFIAGGIAPKIRRYFLDENFVAAFCDKGRMRPLLATMPIKLVIEDDVALHGLCRFLEKNAAAGA